MTPAAIYAAVRDVLILAVIGFIAFKVYELGADQVKVADMKAVQKQLSSNAAQAAAWQKESSDANAQRAQDLEDVRAAVAAHGSEPVYIVRNAPSGGAVPAPAAAAGCGRPASGGTDAGPRGDPLAVDVRPAINAFELKYETVLANCRAAIASWPTPEK